MSIPTEFEFIWGVELWVAASRAVESSRFHRYSNDELQVHVNQHELC